IGRPPDSTPVEETSQETQPPVSVTSHNLGRPPDRSSAGAATEIDRPLDEGHAATEINLETQPPVSVTSRDIGRPPERITSGAANNLDHPSDEAHADADITNTTSRPPESQLQDPG